MANQRQKMAHPLPDSGPWPALEWDQWKDTAETLHLYTQIVGKTRLALTPIQNHWWNVPLYVTARGLSTSAMPAGKGELLDIEFDFIDHVLVFRKSDGQTLRLNLRPMPVAEFYREFLRTMSALGVEVKINPVPAELANPIRFDKDTIHVSYDREAVYRFWRVLIRADSLFKRFSTHFYGKISPVHFFWGSFDLAVTRFNGKKASPRPGANAIEAEAYSHEVISAGFWPGNGGYGRAAFYAYAAPTPAGLNQTVLRGKGAFNQKMGEFVLHYSDVRTAANPAQTVLTFLEETYSAAADLAKWDRKNLDRTDAIPQAALGG
jgi:hypothetical protein